MQLTGHKTRAVFERYNIVSAGDLRDATQRLHGYAARDVERAISGQILRNREVRTLNAATIAPPTATGRNVPNEILCAISGHF